MNTTESAALRLLAFLDANRFARLARDARKRNAVSRGLQARTVATARLPLAA